MTHQTSAPHNPPPPVPGTHPAGWYPFGHDALRYWDGYEWTDNIAPRPPQQTFGMNDSTYAVLMHLGALFVSFLVPLVMWLVKRDSSAFIDHHGKQALNLQITMWIVGIVSIPLMFVIVGFFTFFAAIVLCFVFAIVAAIKAGKGEYYTIPVAIQFLR